MDLTDYKCPKCSITKNYSKEYDCFYCQSCNEWLEDICNNSDCEFCKNRPLTPKENND